MRHIRYLATTMPVCELPEYIDKLHVIVDRQGASSFTCRDCSAVLYAHNKKSYEAELAIAQNARVNRTKKKPLFETEKSAFTTGFIVGSVLWVVIFLILWVVTYG